MELKSTFSFQGWTIKYALSPPTGPGEAEVKTVVFVHGTPWSSDVFQPITSALLARGRYRILLYDLPGYGQSQAFKTDQPSTAGSRFAGDTSVKFQALALVQLLQHLGLDQGPAPAVIAHDIAGAIALRAHLLHGCPFRSLLLLDTNTVLPWGDGFYKLVRSEPDVFLKLPSGIFEAVVRAVIRSALFNPTKLSSGWEESLARPWIPSGDDTPTEIEAKQRSFVRQIAQANDADVAEMLDRNLYEKVQCPVKIVWGENDAWIPREKMERLAGMITHRLEEFVVIPEAGHLVMIDQGERVACEIFDWLTRH